MSDRDALIDAYLAQTRWAGAVRAPLAGDASARRYFRLTRDPDGETCVLMDAPPNQAGSVRAFVNIARHLINAGFSAPEILAMDDRRGFLLIEDFGDALFAEIVREDASRETELYDAALDVLVRLQAARLPEGIATFTPALMARQASLVCDSYAGQPEKSGAFGRALEPVLTRHLSDPNVLMLRDYHAENLVWLPQRTGFRRVGLLDFQDAMAGPVGYDLISLIHDARREVSQPLANHLVARFTAELSLDPQAFEATRAVLCAQRNLRILGVFARLSRQLGKAAYVDLIPRVWAHLVQSMRHSALQPIASFVDAFPPPSADHLEALRTPCDASPQ